MKLIRVGDPIPQDRCLPNDDHVCPLTEEQVERANDEVDRWNYDDYDDYEGDEEDE